MYKSYSSILRHSITRLYKRGFTRSMKENNKDCAYGGIGCTIGVLNNVALFAPKWDSLELDDISSVKDMFPEDFAKIFHNSIAMDFLITLQNVHDDAISPDRMRNSYSRMLSIKKWQIKLPYSVQRMLWLPRN